MATYTAPFQRDAISEVVPRALELSSLSKSSLLTGRRRIRVIPQTGQTYGGPDPTNGAGRPTIANILLQDSAGLLDMQSVVLSMNIKTNNTSIPSAVNAMYQTGLANAGGFYVANGATGTIAPTTASAQTDPYLAYAMQGQNVSSLAARAANTSPVVASNPDVGKTNILDLKSGASGQAGTGSADADPIRTAVLDDFAWSVFRRIQISLNSQLVDDLDYCGRRATTEVYMSASPDWYQTIGTVMGAWKYCGNNATMAPSIVRPAYNGAAASNKQYIASYPVRTAVDPYRFTDTLAQAQTRAQADGLLTVLSTPALAPNSTANIAGTGAADIQNNFGQFCDLSSAGVGRGVDIDLELLITTVGSPGYPATTARIIGTVRLNYSVIANPSGSGFIINTYEWLGEIDWLSGGQLLLIGATPDGQNLQLNANTASGGVPAGVNNLKFTDQDPERTIQAVVPSYAFGAAAFGDYNTAFAPYTMVAGLRTTGQPLGAVPYGAAALAREDVLGKLYSSSAFFKGAVFRPGSTTADGGWYCARFNPTPEVATSGLWQTSPNGPKFSIPLGLLSHLFRQEQLFPLRNAGQLIMQIQFADPQECCFAAPAVSNAPGLGVSGCSLSGKSSASPPIPAFGVPTATYTVTNLELECDIVTAIPEYTAILDSICSRPADKGLAIAFDSHLSSLQQVTSAAAATPGAALGNGSLQSYTLIASKGSENVRSFHFTLSPTAGLRSFEYLQNSTFPAYDMQQWQMRIGSVYYPAFPSQGLSKNYMEMLSSVNAPMPSVGQAAIVNYNMFRTSTPSVAWAAASPSIAGANYEWFSGAFSNLEGSAVSNIPGVSNLLNIDPVAQAFADGYIGGYCFDNLKHAEPLSHDGLDTRAIAGGMIQLDFTCRPLEAFAVIFHIRFTRTIVLAENGVSIVG